MLLDVLVKTTVVLGVATVFSVASRAWATAAVRHAVWVAALLGAVLVPAFSAVLPALRLPLLPGELRAAAPASVPLVASAPAAAPGPAGHDGTRPAPGEVNAAVTLPPPRPAAAAAADSGLQVEDTRALVRAARDAVAGMPAVAALWAIGAAALLARLLLSRVSAARLTGSRVPGRAPWLPAARRLAAVLRVPRRVRFLRSDRVSMPMAVGVLHPAVVLPVEADAWTPERLQSVLLHELAHVRRRDCLTQIAADAAWSLLWVHPLAWVARRAIRRERERACDDLVLAAGTPAPEYASHLLDVARLARRRAARLTVAGGVAMARRTELEGRLMAILDDARPRRALTIRAGSAVAVLMLGLVVPTSALDLWQAPDLPPQAVPASPTERPGAGRPGAGRPGLAGPGADPLQLARAMAEQPATAEPEPIADPTPMLEPAPVPSARVVAGPMPFPEPVPATDVQLAPVPAATRVLRFDLEDVRRAMRASSAPLVAAFQAAAQAPVIAPTPAPPPVPPVPPVADVQAAPVAAATPAKAPQTPADPRVVAALTEALKDSDAEVRQQAMHTLAGFRDPAAVDALTGALAQTDPDLRRQAAFALAQIRDPRAEKALAGLVSDQDPQVRREALAALARRRDPAALEPLAAALKDADPEVREHAAFALGQLRDPRAVPALAAAVSDGNRDVREVAIFALGQLRSAEALPAFMAALKDSDAGIREQAVFALGQLRDARAVDALMTAARDGHVEVRRQAYFALGQVGDARAQDLVIAGLKDSDAEVRRMAAFALARIAGREK